MIGLPPDPSQLPPTTNLDGVVPLRLAHVWAAAATWENVSIHDPVDRYVTDEEAPGAFAQSTDHFLRAVALALSLKHRVALTAREGKDWIIVAPPPRAADPRRPIDRAADDAAKWIHGLISRKYGSFEQKRRNAEYEAKIQKALWDELGDRVYDMFCIMTLATLPDLENSPIAHSLLAAITSLADIGGVGCWVQVDIPEETAFYERHGFKTAVPIILGDDNPSWPKEPVVLQLMVREPQPRIAPVDVAPQPPAQEEV